MDLDKAMEKAEASSLIILDRSFPCRLTLKYCKYNLGHINLSLKLDTFCEAYKLLSWWFE